MRTLYIDRQGTQLQARSGVLYISTPDGVGDRRLPLTYLARIVLRTDTQLSSQTLCAPGPDPGPGWQRKKCVQIKALNN
jgi:hypothetical protein